MLIYNEAYLLSMKSFSKEWDSEEDEYWDSYIENNILNKKPIINHKAKVLTKEEVEANRSSAYKYLDLK